MRARLWRIARKPIGIVAIIIGAIGGIVPGTPGLGLLFFVGIDIVFGTQTLSGIKKRLARKRSDPPLKNP